MSERSERLWSWVLVVAGGVYLVSLFLDWWVARFTPKAAPLEAEHLYGLSSRLGEICVLLAIAILVLALTTWRSRERSVRALRLALASALPIFTLAALASIWRDIADYYPSEQYLRSSHPGYGFFVALITSLIVLSAALVLDKHGVRPLVDRARRRSRSGESA